MGIAPTPVLVSETGVGNSSLGKIHRDSIDDMLGALQSKLLIYLRAKTITPANASFVDALGNTVTAQTSGVTRNASDSTFNNHESITFDNANNQYTMAAGGIGIGAPPQPMTNSFTVLAGIKPGSTGPECLYGDNAGTNDSHNLTGFYNDDGIFHGNIGNFSLSINGGAAIMTPGSVGVSWFSFDAAASIFRFGVNNGNILSQESTTATRTGAGTGTVCYPFGYQNSGAVGLQSFNKWALFNKAFMNGAVPSDDAQFSALVVAYAAYLGA